MRNYYGCGCSPELSIAASGSTGICGSMAVIYSCGTVEEPPPSCQQASPLRPSLSATQAPQHIASRPTVRHPSSSTLARLSILPAQLAMTDASAARVPSASAVAAPWALASFCDPKYPPISVDSYNAYIGDGILYKLPLCLPSIAPAAAYALISDTNVFPLYGQRLVDACQQAGITLHHYQIAPGEASKTRQTKAELEDWLLSLRCGRDTCLLALGGGVIGDLVGFLASTYMRGIPYIHLPSSLLAMVDSSIGGKTGIDVPLGKNLIGSFWRPRAVLIDVELLTSLPHRQLSNGMAESIKAGAIAEESLFSLIESNADRLLACELSVLCEVIYRSVAFKARVVCADEREGGERAILNFGHSIGHAIEALMLPTLLHGECVAIGMMEEAVLARSLGHITSAVIRRLDQCLTAFKLPTHVPAECGADEIVERMGVDKKNKNGRKELVLLTSIGSVKSQPAYTTTVSDQQLYALLTPSITVVPPASSPHGHVSVPGSKSLSNRILLLSALGRGQCRVRGLLHSQDTQVMLDSLRELGVSFSWEDKQQVLVMQGSGGSAALRGPKKPLYLHNAGTASRFLTSIATLVRTGECVLTGNARMKERPIADLVDALKANGCQLTYEGKVGCLPVRVKSVGGFPGGEITLRANISSQYVSSILLAAPHAMKPITLRLDTGSTGGAVVSKPFIDMTVDLMRKFNINVKETAPFVYQIPQLAYDNPADILVEGDASSATYPLALAAVSGGAEVTVDNVGSDSLQGDSKFCDVLRTMGCTVTQTNMTTTVRGPQRLSDLRAVTVDMDALTDTFMTLAAVAVFATGTTRITNIANQRVKECNRLQVMVEELNKCGVAARETDTGLDIEGKGGADWTLGGREVVIDCHDDHRIAMSFSILAVKVAGVVIDDKRCVDKTYPEYWDHLTQHLHCTTAVPASALAVLPVCPTPASPSSSSPSSALFSSFPLGRSSATLVVIGMRGAGKTTLGRATATALSTSSSLLFRFIDIDDQIVAEVGSISAYVASHGWPAFRRVEADCFFRALKAAEGSNVILSCGGGIVETLEVRTELKRGKAVVVWLHRDIGDIVRYLKADTTRPSYSLDAEKAYALRRPWFEECSQYEYTILPGDEEWKETQSNVLSLFQHILGLRRYTVAPHSFFLSLTFPDVTPALPYLSEMTEGVDAIELRVDLWERRDRDWIRAQVAKVRKHSHLPLIWTVRSEREGGAFNGSEDEMADLLLFGLRLGCEYVDVEVKSAGRLGRRKMWERKRHTLLIGSHHSPGHNGGSDDNIRDTLHLCTMAGNADIVKLVVSAKHVDDATRLMHVCEQEKERVKRPTIVIAMGEKGKVSRAMNEVLTPVTHPLLPTSAAPGQMSVRELMQARQLLSLIPNKHFYLFGSPIGHSPSPLLHNTAFQQCFLPFHYSKVDTIEIDRVAEVVKGSSFGGASVTLPLKEEVAALCTGGQSKEAITIGAVNTLIRQDDGLLYGDNTDWVGIHRLLHPLLPSIAPLDVAVVIGAGGTARAALYALSRLGFSSSRLLVHNPRTHSKAEELALAFTAQPLHSLTPAELGERRARVIVATLPGAVAWKAQEGVITAESVVLDASYLPAETALSGQAHKRGAVVVKGLDMLIEQGLAQFERWTGRSSEVVRSVVDRAVRDEYRRQWEGH